MAKHMIHVRQRKQSYELIGQYTKPFKVGDLIAGIRNENTKLKGAMFWRVLSYNEESQVYTVMTEHRTKTTLTITGVEDAETKI
jgi:hypothetical protein